MNSKQNEKKTVRFFSGKNRFNPGTLRVSPGVVRDIPLLEMASAVYKHLQGDWGSISDFEWDENEKALEDGRRLISEYKTVRGTRFWIIKK